MIDFKVVIPAAGRGSRSGLTIPKSLQPIEGIPIIIRICNQLLLYDENPIIIINPKDLSIFKNVFDNYKIKPIFCFQEEALGMGHSILQAKEQLENVENVILIWSDIPLIQFSTIENLINCHIVNKNCFSIASYICKNPYTIISRNDNGEVLSLDETHKTNILKQKKGERDIGLFVFNAKIVMMQLEKEFLNFEISQNIEFGFLAIIKTLVKKKCKVQAFPISNAKDILSFNTPQDLQKIIFEAKIL